MCACPAMKSIFTSEEFLYNSVKEWIPTETEIVFSPSKSMGASSVFATS